SGLSFSSLIGSLMVFCSLSVNVFKLFACFFGEHIWNWLVAHGSLFPCRGDHPALTGDGTVMANGLPVINVHGHRDVDLRCFAFSVSLFSSHTSLASCAIRPW